MINERNQVNIYITGRKTIDVEVFIKNTDKRKNIIIFYVIFITS